MEPTDSVQDVVIIGGGIAGSAMATVLARSGLRLTLLERQAVYQDRVRGEYLAPWGVAEAQRIGLLDALLGAGGIFAVRMVGYDETRSPQEAEAAAQDLSRLLPGVPGPLCVGHPAACAALSAAAEAAGATVLRGVGQVRLTAGPNPAVVVEHAGETRRLTCRLVIGADGRNSSARSQAGIPLLRGEPSHTIIGLLVDGAETWPQDVWSLGAEGDLLYFAFPQGGRRVRLYAGTAPDERDRFAGPNGARRFLAAIGDLSCLPYAASLAAATPIGPCATMSGEDTWTDTPVTEGVALIGDAAGYNDPIIGQGLSLALRDVRVLSELLLAGEDWSASALAPYAEERRERMRRLRFTAALVAALYATFGPEGVARRKRFQTRLASGNDLSLGMATAAAFIGPDRVPAWAFETPMRAKVLQ